MPFTIKSAARWRSLGANHKFMKKKLTKEEAEVVQNAVRGVFETGKPWEAELLHHPAGAIIDAVLKIKGVKKCKPDDENADGNSEGFPTNGWDWDWWQQFSYNGKNYTLCGSGFYGGHSFHTADE
jgi:hypothetical protein